MSAKNHEQRKIMKQIDEEREQNRLLLLQRQRNQWINKAIEYEQNVFLEREMEQNQIRYQEV